MSKTPKEQLEILRQISSPRFNKRLGMGCLAATVMVVAGIVITAYYLDDWGVLPFAPFAIVFALAIAHSARQTAPHMRDARQAIDHYQVTPGMVRIVMTSDDGSDYYRAGVRDRQGRDWTFSFRPQEWKPVAGVHPAELRYIDGVDWPALIVTEQGILYPQLRPEAQTLAPPAAPEPDKPASALAVLLAGLVLLMLGLLLLAGAWGAYLKDTGIVRSGAVADAQVVRAGHLRAKRGESHGLVYRFTATDGQVIERTWSEEDARWKAYRVGDSIRVHYDPEDPGRNFPRGEGVTSLGMTLFISAFGLVVLVAGVLFLISGLRRKRASTA